MSEIVFAFDGEWKVQVLTGHGLASQPQFKYSIYPVPFDINLGFIIERQGIDLKGADMQGLEMSRVLFYDLNARVNHPDGTFRYCGITELARFPITMQWSHAENMLVDIRGSAELRLNPSQRAAVDKIWVDMFTVQNLKPQEPLQQMVVLSEKDYFIREAQMQHLKEKERQLAYNAYVAFESAKIEKQRADSAEWHRIQSNIKIQELTQQLELAKLRSPSQSTIGSEESDVHQYHSGESIKPPQDSATELPIIAAPPPPPALHAMPKSAKVKTKIKVSAEQQLADAFTQIGNIIATAKNVDNIDYKLLDKVTDNQIFKSQTFSLILASMEKTQIPIKVCEKLIGKDDKIVPVNLKIALLKKIASFDAEEFSTLKQPQNIVNKINALAKSASAEENDDGDDAENKFLQELKIELNEKLKVYNASKSTKTPAAAAKPEVKPAPAVATKSAKPIDLLKQSFENLDASEANMLMATHSGLKSQLDTAFNSVFTQKKDFDLERASSYISDLDIDAKFCLQVMKNIAIRPVIIAAILQRLTQSSNLEFNKIHEELNSRVDFELLLQQIEIVNPAIVQNFHAKVVAVAQEMHRDLIARMQATPQPTVANLKPYLQFIDQAKINGQSLLSYAIKNSSADLVLAILNASSDATVLMLDEQKNSILHLLAEKHPANVKLFAKAHERFHEALQAKLPVTSKVDQVLPYLLNKKDKTFLDVLIDSPAGRAACSNILNEMTKLYERKVSWLQLAPMLVQRSVSVMDADEYIVKAEANFKILNQLLNAMEVFQLLAKLDDEDRMPLNDVFKLQQENNVIAGLTNSSNKEAEKILGKTIAARLAIRAALSVAPDRKLKLIFGDNDLKETIYRIIEQPQISQSDLALAKKLILIDVERYLSFLTTSDYLKTKDDYPDQVQPNLLQCILADIASKKIDVSFGNRVIDLVFEAIKGTNLTKLMKYEDGSARTCADDALSIMVERGVTQETIAIFDNLINHGASVDGMNYQFNENVLHMLFLVHGERREETFDFLEETFDFLKERMGDAFVVQKLTERVDQMKDYDEDAPTPIERLKELKPYRKEFVERLEKLVAEHSNSNKLQNKNRKM